MPAVAATHTFVTQQGRRVVSVVIERLDREQWVDLHGQPAKRFVGSNGMIEYTLDGKPAGRAYLSGFNLTVALDDKGRDLARGVLVRR